MTSFSRSAWMTALLSLGCARAIDTSNPWDGGFKLVDADRDGMGLVDGCGTVEARLEARHPTVVLLIDQSASMADILKGTSPPRTKWEVVRQVLVAGDEKGMKPVLPEFESDMHFGATLFSSAGGLAWGTCPILTSTTLGSKSGATSEIATLLSAATPHGDTPTGDSIDAVAQRLESEPGPKYIALLTDGEPDTCEAPNPDVGQEEAILSTEIAYTKGIRTFIIGLGDEVSDKHLQAMANVGAGFDPDGLDAGADVAKPQAVKYKALDPATLHEKFREIVFGLRSCFISLAGVIKDRKAGVVTLTPKGGDPLELVYPTDYQFNHDDQIELRGDACAKIKTGEYVLRVVFRCGGFDPSPR